METNKNTCIVNWDLYQKAHPTTLKFCTDIKNLHLKKDNNEKSKENTNKKNKVERDVKPQ
jgi:hypothetical protein